MPEEISLTSKVEALLFFKNEPVNISWLSKVLGEDEKNIRGAINELGETLRGRGVVLQESELGGDALLALGTHPAIGNLIEKLTKDELDRDIGKAGLETLAIVLYKGPISRSSVDYIRGVNSQFILRHLLARGLVEREQDAGDGRSFLYRPTVSLLSHFGLRKLADLPNYEDIRNKLTDPETGQHAEKNRTVSDA